MKKILYFGMIIILLGFAFTSTAFAEAKLPRLLLKSFLPLPGNQLIVYGKVIYVESHEVDKPLTKDKFEIFMHHRAKDLPLTISIGNSSIETKTDSVGDFVATLTEAMVVQIRGETLVVFSSSQFSSFYETAIYNMPLQPLFLIVSDVDDSVLVSGEGNLFKSIGNSLFRPIHRREAVAGTPEIYQKLVKGTQGIDSLLVFLSGSPVYLAPRIETFFKDQAFPAHALILQNTGPKEFISNRLKTRDNTPTLAANTTQYKLLQLAKLFKWYPDLPVIMLGDSLAKDPEIYQQMAELFPGKVYLVVIRNITKQPFADSRYDGLKKVVKLIVWNDPLVLKSLLEKELLIASQVDQGNSKSGFGGGN